MYTLLLVDDEKIIREGIRELLTLSDLDLDITTAASAMEALAVMEQQRKDIILMDIRMPQMSGLELYDIIREKWPHTKIIFLTGHLEFDYVYKVHRHARYVLKAEEDDKILEAVRETIQDMEKGMLLEMASQNRDLYRQSSAYFERMVLLKELAEGSTDPHAVTQETLEAMDAPLNLDRPIHCLMIRCMELRKLDYSRRSQAGRQMSLLMQKIFFEGWTGAAFGYNKSLTYLLLQPRSDLTGAAAAAALEGAAELYQKALARNLSLPVSIFIRQEPSDFPGAIRDFLPICDALVSMDGEEIRLDRLSEAPSPAGLSGSDQRELGQKVLQLDHLFENQDRDAILLLLHQVNRQIRDRDNMGDFFILELYGSLSARVLSYAKKAGLNQDPGLQGDILSLYDLSRYTRWDKAFIHLQQVVERIFRHMDRSIESKNQDVVNTVKAYIHGHLDGDTSLYALSRHVHLCPEHLLRLFKKREGITVLQYINDLKLSRAQMLLSQTDMPIKDIASSLGFTSTGYFGRFFKSKMNITPNAYREETGER